MRQTIILGSLFLGSLALSNLSAQQVYFEDFEGNNPMVSMNTNNVNSGTTFDNNWVINNKYTGGQFTPISGTCFNTLNIPNTAAQPGTMMTPNGKYMHIASSQSQLGMSPMDNAHYCAADNNCYFAGNYFTRTTSINTSGLSGVTLKFWWIAGGSPNAFGEMYYSTNGGSTWTQWQGLSLSNQPSWTQTVISSVIFDNQANLMIGWRFVNNNGQAGTFLSLGIDNIEVSAPVVTPNLSTGDLTTGPILCPGMNISVPYTVTGGNFQGNNNFALELSDENGVFSGNIIGTQSGTSSGSISATLPQILAGGNGYKFRVNASNPVVQGTASSNSYQVPDALNLSFTHTISGLTVNVTNTSTVSPGAQWLFCPNNSTGQGINYAHTFAASGTYCVCLTANNGCVADTICQDVSVCADVVANLLPSVNGPVVTLPNNVSGADSVAVIFVGLDTVYNPVFPYQYTYTSLGPKTICMYAYNSCGNSDSDCVDITISSIQSIQTNEEWVRVSPNPANQKVQISAANMRGLKLINMTGQTVLRRFFDSATHEFTLSLDGLANGVYILEIQAEQKSINQRLLIQH
jgi:hypothetical protein